MKNRGFARFRAILCEILSRLSVTELRDLDNLFTEAIAEKEADKKKKRQRTKKGAKR